MANFLLTRSRRRPTVLAGITCLAAIASPVVGGTSIAAEPGGADALALYGDEIRFDVLRDGAEAGYHTVRFAQTDGGLRVTSMFELEARILFLTAYRYVYRSDALWREGRLARLDVDIDDDGTPVSIDAVGEDDRLSFSGPEGRFEADAGLLPTNHWNAEVLGRDRVLNTLTGRVNRVRILPAGEELVDTERGRVPATRYRYTGDLDTEVWYDRRGRWVKMHFEARDGSTVEYVCRRCQGPAGEGAG